MKAQRILCIHGIGGKDAQMNNNQGWVRDWRQALKGHLQLNDQAVQFMPFDSFFKPYNANAGDYIEFLAESFLGLLRWRRNQKNFFKDWMDNYPDMVVEFLKEPKLRQDLRKELRKYLVDINPDVIYAHSLGSLLCYDYFSQPENQNGYGHISLVTAGSQLGNPFLKGHVPYPIVRLPLKRWFNLNNNNDNVFARYNLPANYDNFKQIETLFDDNDFINHNGLSYINNSEAIAKVWQSL
ncbi:hypothetical protein [Chryseobacterium sp.]|uniref:hypothetical protein n=1 Tax=Chryseobacterium sp. TaxID=1871047 RepID=UPI0024E20159|nr:hypothetical protein [Chryseobacterium sp.]